VPNVSQYDQGTYSFIKHNGGGDIKALAFESNWLTATHVHCILPRCQIPMDDKAIITNSARFNAFYHNPECLIFNIRTILHATDVNIT
jgi:hypothetical protein